ncbi:MAG: MFS transporter [Kiloniellales bacterium]
MTGLFGQLGVRWRTLVAIIACLTVFDVTLGLSYPLLALILEARGVDAVTTGLNAAMTSVGLIVAAPFVPSMARRLGTRRFLVAGIVVAAATLVLFKVFSDLATWFVLRFVLGAAISGLYAVSEAWINELTTNETRGRVVAIYSSLLSLGFAAGPFLVAQTGTGGWTPFLIGAGFALAGVVPLLAARGAVGGPSDEEHPSFLAFFRLAPTLLIAVGIFSFFDAAVLSLFPLYGLRKGLDEATAANALGVLIAGNIVLQYPIGWLADHAPRRAVMVGCAALTALGSLLLPVAFDSLFLWPLLFVWGSTAFGVYTLAMTELGDRFRGALLLAGSAAFAAMWGVGGILGPPLGGAAMEAFGPDGLPLMLFVSYAALAILGFLRRRA